MTPTQQQSLDEVLSLDDEVRLDTLPTMRVTRPHSQSEFVDLCAGMWWPRLDDRLEVLLLDPLDWNVQTEWLFGCRTCGLVDGYVERLPNGAGFCSSCWAKGEQNSPVFASYCHPFDWVIMRGRDQPLHPLWLYHTFNVFRIREIPLYFAGWGGWIAKTEIAVWEPNDDAHSDWRFADSWRERVSGRDWGCLNRSGEFFPQTTTWNQRQLSPDDNYEVSMYHVGDISALPIAAEYQQFPKGLA